jgi:hypothetical protein
VAQMLRGVKSFLHSKISVFNLLHDTKNMHTKK